MQHYLFTILKHTFSAFGDTKSIWRALLGYDCKMHFLYNSYHNPKPKSLQKPQINYVTYPIG